MDQLDNTIHLLSLSDKDLLDTSKDELDLIFNSSSQKVMDELKITKMLDGLKATRKSRTSFGELITEQIDKLNVNQNNLIEETSISMSLLEKLKGDLSYPNSIPVLSMTKLFQSLNVSIDQGITSLRKTFELLNDSTDDIGGYTKEINISYRRTGLRKSIQNNNSEIGKKDSIIFRNEKSFNIYVDRLQEILSGK